MVTTKRVLARFADFRRLLGLLQLRVGAAVGGDLAQQQPGLATGLLLGRGARLLGEHQEPGRDRGDDDEHEEGPPHRAREQRAVGRSGRRGLEEDHQQDRADQRRPDERDDGEAEQRAVEVRAQPPRHQPAEQGAQLGPGAAVRLAGVRAAGVERAAERADHPAIGRAEGGVLRLEAVAADDAGAAGRLGAPVPARPAGEIEAPSGRPGDHRSGEEGRGEARERGCRARQRAEIAGGA